MISSKFCKFDPCLQTSRAYGLCYGHIGQYRAGKKLTPLRYKTPKSDTPDLCTFDECDNKHEAKGFCSGHNKQVRQGKELKPLQRRNPKGSGTIKDGYVLVMKKDHPNAQRRGKIFEHVLVMSNYLGRALLPGETVHHKNGVRHDNRIENLELWVSIQPAGQRPEDLLEWAHEIIRRYS